MDELVVILTARGTPNQGANKRVHGAGYPTASRHRPQDRYARRRPSAPRCGGFLRPRSGAAEL